MRRESWEHIVEQFDEKRMMGEHMEATRHRFLWDELPRVAALVDRIVIAHCEQHPELADIAMCFSQLQADLESHMIREERRLYPKIRKLAASDGPMPSDFESLRTGILLMLEDHDVVNAVLTRLRYLTSGYAPPSDACATYVACFSAMADIDADTRMQVQREDDVLFPLAVRMEAERATAVAS